jgi:hypothetical protein
MAALFGMHVNNKPLDHNREQLEPGLLKGWDRASWSARRGGSSERMLLLVNKGKMCSSGDCASHEGRANLDVNEAAGASVVLYRHYGILIHFDRPSSRRWCRCRC